MRKNAAPMASASGDSQKHEDVEPSALPKYPSLRSSSTGATASILRDGSARSRVGSVKSDKGGAKVTIVAKPDVQPIEHEGGSRMAATAKVHGAPPRNRPSGQVQGAPPRVHQPSGEDDRLDTTNAIMLFEPSHKQSLRVAKTSNLQTV